jgi:hypothetical protein
MGFKVLLTRRHLTTSLTPVLMVLIVLYVPLASLNFYSNLLTEVVYEGLGYRVSYRSPLIPLSNDKTTVVLDVKRGGKPIDFGYTMSGITVDGGVDVSHGRGYGRVQVDITGYVNEVVRVLRMAGSNPAYSGLGLLTFIVSKVEENGEEYVATDVITIPLIPGKVRGRSVVVEVEFKPVHKIKLNKTEGEGQVGVEWLQTAPPRWITDFCHVSAHRTECYGWELKTVHYKSPAIDFVPLAISYVDGVDGDYIKEVEHYHLIRLASYDVKTLSLDLPLVFKNVVEFIVPGPGFVRTLREGLTEEHLFSLKCPIVNSALTSDRPKCSYFGSPIGVYTFYDDALVSTGFYGYLWLVEYEYVRYVSYDAVTFRYVLDVSLAVYLVPQEVDGRFSPAIVIDDSPYDGFGTLEKVYRFLVRHANTTWKLLPSVYTNYWYIESSTLVVESSSTPLFGIAIPVGAVIVAITGGSPAGWLLAITVTLSVGFSVSKDKISWYNALSVITFETTVDRWFNPRYIELTTFLIKEDGKYYRTPLIVIWPFTI